MAWRAPARSHTRSPSQPFQATSSVWWGAPAGGPPHPHRARLLRQEIAGLAEGLPEQPEIGQGLGVFLPERSIPRLGQEGAEGGRRPPPPPPAGAAPGGARAGAPPARDRERARERSPEGRPPLVWPPRRRR